jgi:Holliday junction resolvasome RuvABC endonuclease subunit
MILVGIDYSYTSPGIVVFKGGSSFTIAACEFFSYSEYNIKDFNQFHFKSIIPYNNDMERFENIANWALEIIKEYKPEQIGLEDYAARALGRTFSIGENTGILKYKIYKETNIPVQFIPPTVIKKSATGKGNATKDMMVDAFSKNTQLDLKARIQPKRKLGSPTSDLVDAYFIAEYLYRDFYKKS